jgi:hypothetical protein
MFGDPNARHLIRALIRLCFSQWDYDSHFGGSSFAGLLTSENPIVSHHFAADADPEDWEEIVHILTEYTGETSSTGVSLFYDGLVRRISDEISPTVQRWTSELRKRNYYLIEPDAKQVLGNLQVSVGRVVHAGTRVFRVRIGTEKRFDPMWGDWDPIVHHVPFQNADVSAPPPRLSGFGRANRQGVSFLYVASDSETAVAETRPHPGHVVSIGAFSNARALKVADFSDTDFLDYYRTDELLREYLLLKTIDAELSTPVPPEEQHRYAVTQLIVDVLRQLGYDGVAYRSSVGPGKNYAFFNPEEFVYEPSGASVLKIESVRYEVTEIPFKLELGEDDFEIK